MTYTLVRNPSEASGTLGRLYDEDGKILCFTMELPWNDNEPDKSCIPIGVYNVVAHNSEEHPNTFEITDVPGRSGILLHDGNTELDSLGCILCGNSIGVVNNLPAVLNSKATLKKLNRVLPKNFTLSIE